MLNNVLFEWGDFMNRELNAYVINYSIPVKESYEALKLSYKELKEQVEKLLEDNKNNKAYKIKMDHGIDKSILVKGTRYAYTNYEVQVEKRIENKLEKFHFLDQKNLTEVMELRKELLEFNKEISEMDTVGTILNYLREFYNDVELDIEQNRIIDDSLFKENEKGTSFIIKSEDDLYNENYFIKQRFLFDSKLGKVWDYKYVE